MHLLRFTFENHRSFRDEATLDLTRPTLKTLRPSKGTTWANHIHHVDGIYGANASGKTNVLDALHYMLSAIYGSATSWLENEHFPRKPYALDNESEEAPSSYELEFVHDNIRYEYKFTATHEGILNEILYEVGQKWRKVFSRSSDGHVKGLPGLPRVAKRELALSRAGQLSFTKAHPVWTGIMNGFDIYRVGERKIRNRINSIAKQLRDDNMDLNELITLARIADTGITDIEIEEPDLPPEVADAIKQLFIKKSSTQRVTREGKTQTGSQNTKEDLADIIPPNLLFHHCDSGRTLEEDDESTGTLAWLALGMAAIDALKEGQILVVDELGSSLHPELSHLIIDWFEDPSVNTTGAQLIFTSHDMTLLDAGRGSRAKREQVWFVEKGSDGASELFNLDDFTLQKGSNIVKQYLEGQFGGVPYTAPSLIHNLLNRNTEEIR